MEGTITMQELFDSQADFNKTQASLLMAFNDNWDKHLGNVKDNEWTDEYYKDLKAIADEHEVEYTEPKFRGGLRGVGMPSATIH